MSCKATENGLTGKICAIKLIQLGALSIGIKTSDININGITLAFTIGAAASELGIIVVIAIPNALKVAEPNIKMMIKAGNVFGVTDTSKNNIPIVKIIMTKEIDISTL